MNTWQSKYVPHRQSFVITDEAGNEITHIKAVAGTDGDKETAQLIAAAPDLLNALIALLRDEPLSETAREIVESAIRKAI